MKLYTHEYYIRYTIINDDKLSNENIVRVATTTTIK